MPSGSNYTKFAAPVPATYLGAEWNGKVRATYDTYTFASEAIGTTVNVGVLKPGEVFLGAILTNAALGASTTLQLGDAGNTSRYIVATSTSSAGSITACAQTGIGYKNSTTADIPLYITTAGGTATGQFSIVIFKAVGN